MAFVGGEEQNLSSYSLLRFLRSSSKSVTVPSTILLSSMSGISGSEKVVKGRGRRGGKPCCIRPTSATVGEILLPMLKKNRTTASPNHTPRPTSKVTMPPMIPLIKLSYETPPSIGIQKKRTSTFNDQ